MSVDPLVRDTKEMFVSEALAKGLLLVDLAPPRPAVRGRLALFIEGAIERALDLRGAPPPRSAGKGLSDSVSDQIRRAQVCGVDGVALWFSSLGDIARNGELDPDDSKAVRWCIDAAPNHELTVGFDRDNRSLLIYADPESLGSVLAEMERRADGEGFPSEVPVAFPTDSSELAIDADRDDSGGAAELDDSPDSGAEMARADAFDEPDVRDTIYPDPGTIPDLEIESAHRDMEESARALADGLSDDLDSGWLRDALLELSTPPPRLGTETADVDAESFPPPPAIPKLEIRFAEPPVEEELHAVVARVADHPVPLASKAVPAPAAPQVTEPPVEPEVHEAPARALIGSPTTRTLAKAREEARATDAETLRKLTAYARELELANGPKPLAVVERLFASAYVPLRKAIDRGEATQEIRDAADEWSQNFEKSYLDAFEALRMRTKRPSMVVDIADMALRIARLHGARSTQLLLVDAMRFDLGDTIQEKLRTLVGKRALCAERYLLWSALPTRTSTQIELIGRGPAGLREFSGDVTEDQVVARGKKASMIRRMKTGHRELYKLDVIEARLAEPGGASPDGFDDLATETADRIAAHFEEREPRTLVMVFGDHGFSLERRGDSTVARQGGASPEEVLVPAFAWLVGAVH